MTPRPPLVLPLSPALAPAGQPASPQAPPTATVPNSPPGPVLEAPRVQVKGPPLSPPPPSVVWRIRHQGPHPGRQQHQHNQPRNKQKPFLSNKSFPDKKHLNSIS